MTTTRPKRRTLADFPCVEFGACREDGEEACQWYVICCEATVYREYLALQKCARLLRVFEKRWTGPIMSYVARHLRLWKHGTHELQPFLGALIEFRSAISVALEKAGL